MGKALRSGNRTRAQRGSGRYVAKEYAKANPKKTVTEHDKKKKK